MSLLKKSKENNVAFLLLKEREYYTPAVHCCYYSCFQKIISILKEYYPKEFEEMNKQRNISHSQQISLFTNNYIRTIEKNNGTKIHRFMTQLRDLRKKADYEDELISKEQMEKAESYSKQIHKFIAKDLDI
ncbi:MAG: hypothetical protein J5I98_07925 [Phaeodactylibacter sp.]|nr:hypothetical protein [Phaeodactylibacter sp.]